MNEIEFQDFFTTEPQSYGDHSSILTAKDYEKWINQYSKDVQDEKEVDKNNDDKV